jgi:hypothetical protein
MKQSKYNAFNKNIVRRWLLQTMENVSHLTGVYKSWNGIHCAKYTIYGTFWSDFNESAMFNDLLGTKIL